MGKNLLSKTARKRIINGISLLLAGINITLVGTMSRFLREMLIANAQYGICKTPQMVLFILAVFWLAGAAVFYRLIRGLLIQTDKRLVRHALFWGMLLAASYVMGARLAAHETIFGGAGYVLTYLAAAVCLAVPAASCIAPFLRNGTSSGEAERPLQKKHPLWQAGLFYGMVIFLCWLPVFLAYYPSVFAYDAEGQLYQVIAGDYSTHHPLLHTLFLGAFFKLGGVLGSYSAGMALHSIVQMILLAAAFAFVLSYLYEKGISRWRRMLLLAFYALFPTNSVLSLSTTKDVLFSALVLLYTMLLYHMICDKKMQVDKRDGAACVILSVLLLLFRNNAVYAFLVSMPLVYAGYRKWQIGEEKAQSASFGARTYLVLSIAALLFFAVCSAGLRAGTHAHSGSPREMLSVPLQQMARTRVKEEQRIDPALRKELEKYIPAEWVFAAYDPHLADPVKNRAVIHDDPAGLIETWVKLGMRHLDVYVDAFLDNCVGCWYLEDISHAQIYGIGTESGFGYLSTDNRTMPAGCEIIPHSYLPGLRSLLEKIVSDNQYQRIPVLRIIFAPAFYWWMLCMYMAVAVYRRKYIMLLPVCFLGAYYLTLLLSPAVLIRYMYPFVVTVPAICCCMSRDLTKKDSENTQ
ncbi:MAG: hypothetical protein HFI62_11990 [Lachnospiraceae bacterium]|nr:hypothetical protein [Lachnospiraceae bacterium]